MPSVLTGEDADLLAGANFAFLATLLPDGSPHVTPMWVDIEDGTIVFNTAEGGRKLKNVRRDPRVALSVCDQENPYRMISVRGRVVEVTEEGADRHIDAMAKKYTGAERYEGRSPGERRVLIRVVPGHVARMG